MSSIHDLPDEIIIHMFTYLSLVDRKNIRLICKKWNELSQSMCLIKGDVTVVKNVEDLNGVSATMKHVNVRIKEVGSQTESTEFWSLCGGSIKSIELYVADIYCPVLKDIFAHCINLECLAISTWDDNDTPRGILPVRPVPYSNLSLPKLVSLDLMHMNNLTDEAFTVLTENANKLKRLTIEWFRPAEGTKKFDWSRVVQLVSRQSTLLKELNFSHSATTDAVIFDIMNAVGPQLTGLFLKWSSELTNKSLYYITKNAPNLKEIDISRCEFTPEGILHVIKSLKYLKRISLYKTKLLSEEIMVALSNVENLSSLELSECRNITEHALQKALAVKNRPKIIDLRLCKLKCVSDDLLTEMCPKVPNLRYLFVNGCVRIGDKGLQAICTFNKLLRCLSLQDCKKITYITGDSPCVNDLKGLVHLDLFSCCKINPESIQFLSLPELQTIDLSDLLVDSENVAKMLDGCPSLQHVYLNCTVQNESEFKFKGKDAVQFHFGFCRFEGDSLFE